MSNILTVTQGFNVSGNGNNYAKLFNMKKKFFGKPSWHTNQLLFEIIHASSLSRCITKKYFISVFESDTSQNSTIIFQDLSPLIGGVACVYVDEGDSITVYARGSLQAASLNVRLIYSPRFSLIEFVQYSKFNHALSNVTPVSPTGGVEKATPTFNNDWGFLGDYYNDIKKEGSTVTLNCRFGGSFTGESYAIGRLPQGFRPAKQIATSCIFLRSDGTYGVGRFRVNTFGDLLINGVNRGEELIVNIIYDVS